MRQQNSNGGRRPRGRTNNRKQHSGGQHRSGTYDSNGPDGRIRGNASQVYEKYVGLARDATSSGDRIAAEAYYQHAEHYYRIVNDSTDPESPGSQRAHNPQANAANGAQQPNGEIEANPGNQLARDQQPRPERSDRERSDRDRSDREQRPGRDRSGFQDRRGNRTPARNDVEVPGLEPQPDLGPGNAPAFLERSTQSELPLPSEEDAPRRAPRGRPTMRGRGRPRQSEVAAENEPSAVSVAPDAAADAAGPSLADSIPAAIEPSAAQPQAAASDAPAAEAAPAPRKRGRPRKRPLEEATDAAPAKDVTAEAAEPAPAPKRRGRPRKAVVEAAPASESDDGSDGSNAANA